MRFGNLFRNYNFVRLDAVAAKNCSVGDRVGCIG
jgi:hypothetical protein